MSRTITMKLAIGDVVTRPHVPDDRGVVVEVSVRYNRAKGSAAVCHIDYRVDWQHTEDGPRLWYPEEELNPQSPVRNADETLF